MMDVPGLRSLFMTQEAAEQGAVSPSPSGEGFDETLSQVSLPCEGLSGASSSPEGVPVQPEAAHAVAIPEGEGDFVFPAVGDPVTGDGRLQAGAGTYRRASGEVSSPRDDLCEDFRQLALSARAFERKPLQTDGEGTSGPGEAGDGEDVPDSDRFSEAGREGPEAPERVFQAFCGSAGDIPAALPRQEEMPTVRREHGGDAGGFPDGNVRGKSGRVPAGSPFPEMAEALSGAEWMKASPEHAAVKQETSAGSGTVGLPESVPGMLPDPAVATQVVPPQEGKKLNGKAFPVGDISSGNGERFSPVPGAEEVTGPPMASAPGGDGRLGSGPSGGGPVAVREVLPGSEASSGQSVLISPDGDEGEIPGGHAEGPLAQGEAFYGGNPGFRGMESLNERVSEPAEDFAAGTESLQSQPFVPNPMEGVPTGGPEGVTLLEARGAEAMARGLAETVHVIRKKDGHRGTIEVSPPNLGQVRITVDSSGDSVQVHLRVESVQVRDMLDQTADVLKQAMEDQGLSLTGMSVDVGGDDGSRGWKPRQEPLPGFSGDVPVEDDSEEVIARLDLERGMLHWVA